MKISIKDDTNPYDVTLALALHINAGSRFMCEYNVTTGPRSKYVVIKNIRLKEAKPYCGNHPNACEIGGADRKGKWLEGADWVEFNDRLNDILDYLDCDANVSSSVCILRKDKRRRVYYGSYRDFNQYQWNKDEDDECYENWCGKVAPASEYPFGTPGSYERVV